MGKGFKSLLGKDEPVLWHEAAKAVVSRVLAANPNAGKASTQAVNETLLESKRSHCEALLENEAQAFEQDLAKRNSSDARWLAQVKKSGTTSDRIAAQTLLIQVR